MKPHEGDDEWFEIAPDHWINTRVMTKLFKQWEDADPEEWERVQRAEWGNE